MAMRVIALTIVSLALALGVQAGDRGAPAEAKEKAPFADRDLYVFCIGPDRSMTANGGYPSFVGQSVDVLKDANGKALGKSLIDAAAPGGGGSVKYPHINPVTRKPEPKVSFVQKVGDDVCGVGAYTG